MLEFPVGRGGKGEGGKEEKGSLTGQTTFLQLKRQASHWLKRELRIEECEPPFGPFEEVDTCCIQQESRKLKQKNATAVHETHGTHACQRRSGRARVGLSGVESYWLCGGSRAAESLAEREIESKEKSERG